jgi:hypothetical protein
MLTSIATPLLIRPERVFGFIRNMLRKSQHTAKKLMQTEQVSSYLWRESEWNSS